MNKHNNPFSDKNIFSQEIKTKPIEGGYRVKARYFSPGFAAATIPLRNIITLSFAFLVVVPAMYGGAISSALFGFTSNGAYWFATGLVWFGLFIPASMISYALHNNGFLIFKGGNKRLVIELTDERVRVKRLFGWKKVQRRGPVTFTATNYDVVRRRVEDKENIFRNSKEVWLEHGEFRIRLAQVTNDNTAHQMVMRLQIVNDLVLQ